MSQTKRRGRPTALGALIAALSVAAAGAGMYVTVGLHADERAARRAEIVAAGPAFTQAAGRLRTAIDALDGTGADPALTATLQSQLADLRAREPAAVTPAQRRRVTDAIRAFEAIAEDPARRPEDRTYARRQADALTQALGPAPAPAEPRPRTDRGAPYHGWWLLLFMASMLGGLIGLAAGIGIIESTQTEDRLT